MSFISNASNFTLGDGVYNNVHGDIVYNFYGKTRRREEIQGRYGSDMPAPKRRRLEDEDGIMIIPSQDLKLVRQIGSGSGYFLHAGQNNGRAAIFKVFNRGPTVRQQLESTVALSKDVLHPNVLRIEGISSPVSLTHFIVYEDVFWKNAEGPLATALRNDLQKSITLGFKMVCMIPYHRVCDGLRGLFKIEGLSAGMNHLSVQGISLASIGVENFDIFLDVGDRFLLSINPRDQEDEDSDASGFQQLHENKSWDVFNALCQKVLMSANRALHNEQINRNPAILDIVRSSSVSDNLAAASLSSFGSTTASQNSAQELLLPVPPRREYVWRTMDRGQQSLATVARRIALDLDMNLSPIHRLTQSDERNPHRCPGYVREEITLATTTLDSAVVAHDTPSPLEVCSICHEVVGLREAFRCICGDPVPGSRHTIKCRVCKLWSHSDCVGNPKKQFTCHRCMPRMRTEDTVLSTAEPLTVTNVGTSNRPPSVEPEQHEDQTIEPAVQYVRKIKQRCDAETYRAFLDILSQYHAKPDSIDEEKVATRVALLFKDDPDLRSDFRIFMPEKHRHILELSQPSRSPRRPGLRPRKLAKFF
ncbi:hypothetical protein B0H13DRAFT_2670332 [Mycena leptocephala]|nr:hypothetical protein B0H13DRAFT_2670332 [Mycena leptocephala]